MMRSTVLCSPNLSLHYLSTRCFFATSTATGFKSYSDRAHIPFFMFPLLERPLKLFPRKALTGISFSNLDISKKQCSVVSIGSSFFDLLCEKQSQDFLSELCRKGWHCCRRDIVLNDCSDWASLRAINVILNRRTEEIRSRSAKQGEVRLDRDHCIHGADHVSMEECCKRYQLELSAQ